MYGVHEVVEGGGNWSCSEWDLNWVQPLSKWTLVLVNEGIYGPAGVCIARGPLHTLSSVLPSFGTMKTSPAGVSDAPSHGRA